MWLDTSTSALGERSQSQLAASIHSETTGNVASMTGVRSGRAMSLMFTGFTAAAAFLALTNEFSAQTLRAPNYAETASRFPIDRLAVAVPLAFQEAISEMLRYQNLASGWDGIGSVAPRPPVIESAIGFLRAFPLELLAPEPSVSADGSVSWFWNTASIYATVSFTRPGKFAYYAKNKQDGSKIKGVGVLDNSVPQELIDFIRVA